MVHKSAHDETRFRCRKTHASGVSSSSNAADSGLCTPHGLDLRVGEIVETQDFAIAAFQAPIFLGGNHHRPVAALAGADDGLRQSGVLVTPNLSAEFHGRYAYHVVQAHLRDVAHDSRNTGGKPR